MSRAVPAPIQQTEYLIGGELRRWEGPVHEVRAAVPLDGERPVLGSYPLLTATESDAALAAAREAWDRGAGAWPTMAVAERIRHVEDFVQRMLDVREEVVELLMWEIAKNAAAAAKEFDRTVEYVRDTIDALKDLDRDGSRFQEHSGVLAQIRRGPLGVVLCMGPFNYPLNETFTTLIPALIMGNVVIFKPPKIGVLLHQPLLEAFRDCFPAGVVNTVYGDGATVVGPLMESGGLDCLAFIGSSKVANILKKQHPRPHRMRCVLGLEAKNPAVVLPDADLDLAVKECVRGSLSYNGQRCTALKILFVHEDIAEAFTARFLEAADALGRGHPWDEGAALTPLPEEWKPGWLDELVEDARSQGAEVRRPGGLDAKGVFAPAVVTGVEPGMKLYEVEQFGPVVPMVTFSDVEEPVRYMEESPFGQQASLFGTDPGQMAGLIDRLVNQVCRVNLNCACQRGPDVYPFTGRKDSAEGTLSVSDALRVFSIRTFVAAKNQPANKELLRAILRGRESKFLSTDFLF